LPIQERHVSKKPIQPIMILMEPDSRPFLVISKNNRRPMRLKEQPLLQIQVKHVLKDLTQMMVTLTEQD
jgi:hypothetical protein